MPRVLITRFGEEITGDAEIGRYLLQKYDAEGPGADPEAISETRKLALNEFLHGNWGKSIFKFNFEVFFSTCFQI